MGERPGGEQSPGGGGGNPVYEHLICLDRPTIDYIGPIMSCGEIIMGKFYTTLNI